MKKALIIVFVFTSLSLFSQDFSKSYTPIKDSGPLPKSILSSSTAKYKEKKKNVSKKEKKHIAKVKKEFYLESSFIIDDLLHSGKVLFSDNEITKYINSVADELLKDDPKLRNKISIYTIRSSSVNAFATDRGEIFFTMGLIAKLQSEAEIAFILSHEITHFIKKHSLNTAVSFDKIERNQKRISFKRRKNFDPLLKKSIYSKANEIEADLEGAQLLLKTAYNPQAIYRIFDLLEFAHIPFNNEPVDTSFLDLEGLTIPHTFFKKHIEAPTPLKSENEYSTHPDLDERRDKIQAFVATTNKGKDFIISQELFDLAKSTAQFEMCEILLQEINFFDAIYCSSVLLSKYPNNTYLKDIKAYGLYGIAQYINMDRKDEILDGYKYESGNITQIYHTLDNIITKEKNINLVAARHCWDRAHADTTNLAMQLMVKDQVEDLVIYTFEEEDDTLFFSDAKFTNTIPKKDYARTAFERIRKNPEFVQMLKSGTIYRKDKEAEEEKSKKKKKPKLALGLNKAIFINPFYYHIKVKTNKFNKKNQSWGVPILNRIKSEDKQKIFSQSISKVAKRLKFKPTILDTHALKAKSSIDTYNDIVELNNFVDELLRHQQYIIASNYNRVQPLIKKYKTSTIIKAGNIAVRRSPSLQNINRFTFILFASLPFTYYGVNLLTPNNKGHQFAFIIDLQTNQILYHDHKKYKQKDNKYILEMNLYNLIYQVNKKKK